MPNLEDLTGYQIIDKCKQSIRSDDRLWRRYEPQTSQTKNLLHLGFCSFHCYLQHLFIQTIKMESDIGFQAALEEARKGASEGGVPIGACLVSVRSIQDTTQESFLQCDPIALRDSSCTFHLRF
jgi:hypothetical protein